MRTRRRTGRSIRGFTLIELMVVVVLLSLTAALAAMTMRGGRGDKAPVYARALFTMFHEARNTALSTGLPARVRLIPVGTGEVPRAILETPDPVTKLFPVTTPIPAGGLSAPYDVYIGEVFAGIDTTHVGPVPSQLPAQEVICFMPDGKVSVIQPLGTSNTSCPVSPLPNPYPTGATVYVRSADDSKHYEIWIFGQTGMPRILELNQGAW
jgi:prepilin-type N-terminal cleavage/methylation domain-containing protein